jgi:hypothetical protein
MRETTATVYERGKDRKVTVVLSPPDLVGFKLKGMHTTFWLDAEACYSMAVKAAVLAEKKEKEKRKPKTKRVVKRGAV